MTAAKIFRITVIFFPFTTSYGSKYAYGYDFAETT